MLDQWLAGQAFAYFLVFCRLGTAIMLLPGIGELYVSPRLRLLFALGFSVLLSPVVGPLLPPEPADVGGLTALAGGEMLVGLFFGLLARILIDAANTAGTIIATQSGLASAVTLGINQTAQTTVVTNLLSITAVTVLFAMDLDHVMLSGLRASYGVFPPGHFPIVGDMANYTALMVSHAFGVGLRLAAPIVAVGLILYLGAGVLSRLMPTMQIFFILMGPQILISFFVLMVTLSGSLMWYMGYMEDAFVHFPSQP